MPAASSIYWDSIDSQRSSGSSVDANSGGARHYVDPWDLENYAYLRRHSVANYPRRENSPPVLPPPPSSSQQRPARRRKSHETRPQFEPEYWYSTRESTREFGHNAPASVDDLYFPPSRQHVNHGFYHQPIYEDDCPRYDAPVPIYAPFSDLDHGGNVEDQRLRGAMKRRNNPSRTREHERDERECFYHGSSGSSRRDSVDKLHSGKLRVPEDACYVDVAPPSNLGLNTYGHLKIDYTDSWNSLHRKISK